jgi:hypothetical protein
MNRLGRAFLGPERDNEGQLALAVGERTNSQTPFQAEPSRARSWSASGVGFPLSPDEKVDELLAHRSHGIPMLALSPLLGRLALRGTRFARQLDRPQRVRRSLAQGLASERSANQLCLNPSHDEAPND